MQSAGFAWFLPRVWGPETGARGQARGSHQNNRAFFLSSFLFQRARRSNSSTFIPNTSWNSSGDKCLFKQKGETRRGQLAASQRTHGRQGQRPHGAAASGSPGPPVPAFPLCPRPSRDAADRTEPGGKGPSATPTHASRTADGGPEHTPRTRTPPAPGRLSPRSVCDVLTRFHGMFMAPPASRRRMAGCAPASRTGETEVRRESREAGPGGPSPTPRPAPPAAAVRSAASALPGPRSPSPGTRSGCTAWGQGHRQQSLWDAG